MEFLWGRCGSAGDIYCFYLSHVYVDYVMVYALVMYIDMPMWVIVSGSGIKTSSKNPQLDRQADS